MENIVSKIKVIQEMYCKIRRLFNVDIPLWLSKQKEYDKVSVEFRKGDSNGFTPGNEIQIHFAAWVGTFGSSDVYAQLQMNKELWQEYFLMYLNVHKKELMLWIADKMEQKAQSLKAEASEKLNSDLEQISAL